MSGGGSGKPGSSNLFGGTRVEKIIERRYISDNCELTLGEFRKLTAELEDDFVFDIGPYVKIHIALAALQKTAARWAAKNK